WRGFCSGHGASAVTPTSAAGSRLAMHPTCVLLDTFSQESMAWRLATPLSRQAGTKLSTSTLVPSVQNLALELTFQVRNDLKKVHNFLQCFPNVETLHIRSEKARGESTGKVGLKFWLEGGPITCIRQHLKKIIFHDFRGSTNETAFLKFIAENARVLKNMVIVVSDWLLSSGVDARAILKHLTCAKWASGACKFQVFKSILREGERPVYGVLLASEVLPSDPFDKIYYREPLL
uniref:Uncharacterized protein n=1 Tax=Aegilops tauschii subsp. strangulata TaxID=200361 RepID=A0A453M7G9_AEGTS